MKRIVLTGGPCAGKTTALVKVIEHFSSLGYKVFIIPEVPTLFSQAGMDYLTDNRTFFYEGEKATLETQLDLEDRFTRMAETIKTPTIIVCDRGTMDISAYMKPEMWEEITAAAGTSSEQLRARYDAVLHLVSAADGAEQFYTTANNAERTEGLELARELDKKVIQAWSEHPHLRVINNHENFDTKINRVLQEISNVLEIPQQVIEERKYIVRLTGEIPDAIESDIMQTYLTSEPRSEVRLRRRTLNGVSINVRTTKKTLPNNEQVVTERQIDNNLYESLMRQADPYRLSIHKVRKTFIWRGQFFELDTYLSPASGLQILETKGIVDHEDVNFPPFLEVLEDITGKTEYYNYNLALRK
ncbi:AAA family ATPase [Prevotella multiformis]|uniref:AAA family ATPase n=1 Tax=Prevotella multiformis TaxID=282402 RepID=UPI001BACF4E9|nr:AAA family ATPase [Prevotella multiformis]QUB72107.1 AAA family ATPase [Prevotella multiformis]